MKNYEFNEEIAKSQPINNEKDTLSSVIDSINQRKSTSLNKQGVVSDFLSIPTSPPKQFYPSNFEKGDELLESYRQEIYQIPLWKGESFNKHQRRESKRNKKKY